MHLTVREAQRTAHVGSGEERFLAGFFIFYIPHFNENVRCRIKVIAAGLGFTNSTPTLTAPHEPNQEPTSKPSAHLPACRPPPRLGVAAAGHACLPAAGLGGRAGGARLAACAGSRARH